MAIFAMTSATRSAVTFFTISQISNGMNDVVAMTVRYSAHRFCSQRPMPSVVKSAAYANEAAARSWIRCGEFRARSGWYLTVNGNARIQSMTLAAMSG